MSDCGEECACSGDTIRENRTIVAGQPEGWHACLKQKTRCIIRVIDPGTDYDTGLLNVKEFEATNSCHVNDAEICPRVTAGSKSGEGYELCGPPNHAEQEAVKLLLKYYPDGATEGVAYLYGHTWLCMDCQHALTAAGVKHFFVTGEPA